MELYRYETHLHTSESSACAIISGAEQAYSYKKAGYTGIIVTDHFFNGNSTVPKNLAWQQRVELFCRGYENAKQVGDRIGLSVFFGWEANFKGTEFLIYGLDKEWLIRNPDILSWTLEEHYEKIHKAGGFVVHAHPFRMRTYIKEVRLFPECTDAVEAYNVGNLNEEFDHKALLYAKKNKLPITGGTDSHGLEKTRSGIVFEKKLENINDYIDGIKSGRYNIINIK
jgi:hypothetical protein